MAISLRHRTRGSGQICRGDLKDRILVKQRQTTPDAYGGSGYSANFTEGIKVYAAIETLSGESVHYGINEGDAITHRIYILYSKKTKSITQEDWIEYNGDIYDIIRDEHLNEGQELLILECNKRGDKNIGGNRR